MAIVPALTGATGSSVCLCVPQHYSSGNLRVALKRYLPSRDIEFSDALEPLARPGRCRTMRIGRAGLSTGKPRRGRAGCCPLARPGRSQERTRRAGVPTEYVTIPDAFAGCSTREGEPAPFGGGGPLAKPERHKMPKKKKKTRQPALRSLTMLLLLLLLSSAARSSRSYSILSYPIVTYPIFIIR